MKKPEMFNWHPKSKLRHIRNREGWRRKKGVLKRQVSRAARKKKEGKRRRQKRVPKGGNGQHQRELEVTILHRKKGGVGNRRQRGRKTRKEHRVYQRGKGNRRKRRGRKRKVRSLGSGRLKNSSLDDPGNHYNLPSAMLFGVFQR